MEWSSMKRHFILSFGVGLAICVLAVSGAWGQTGTTSVHGVVTDKSGAAIVAAQVTIISADQGSQRTVATGAQGEFEFLALQPGTYGLTVDAPGFRKYERKNLQLLVNTPVDGERDDGGRIVGANRGSVGAGRDVEYDGRIAGDGVQHTTGDGATAGSGERAGIAVVAGGRGVHREPS